MDFILLMLLYMNIIILLSLHQVIYSGIIEFSLITKNNVNFIFFSILF